MINILNRISLRSDPSATTTSSNVAIGPTEQMKKPFLFIMRKFKKRTHQMARPASPDSRQLLFQCVETVLLSYQEHPKTEETNKRYSMPKINTLSSIPEIENSPSLLIKQA
jgi:hypothetical protein